MLTLHRDECAKAEHFRGEQICNFDLEGETRSSKIPVLKYPDVVMREQHILYLNSLQMKFSN